MALKILLGTKGKSKLLEKEEERRDLGFGTRVTNANERLVNRDGSFNVKRVNVSFWAWLDPFYRLTIMPWSHFFGVIFLAYLVINCLFSVVYLLIGMEGLAGVAQTKDTSHFWEAFFFSAQTLTTVGYGRVAPVGYLVSTVAAFEALVGLLVIALATGLMYGRFSRPVPKVLFSRNSVLAPYLDLNAWMFRMINERHDELIDVKVEVTLSRLETLPNGNRTRKYYPLKLERSQVNLFPMSWTVVHPITDDSPLYGATEASLMESDSEFLIFARATEEAFTQQVTFKNSYRYEEIVWGAKFRPMFDATNMPGVVNINVELVHEYDLKELN
ncbi:MAG: potassium transporter [Runella slithyformis]|nr:MAG: potassium transporter [Runella slithyformis]TAF94767.1 MAG: potassium transporter [Runella sp.]TAG18022.1 MAG: potassium transporter [Cytophagales bacterium]TAG37534.1 MAG: potassium transporter [Cytophagia bacterium]TAF25668.1 MAG: potassium transporter [Runella slithyformis]